MGASLVVVQCAKRPDLRHLCSLILRSQPVITSTLLSIRSGRCPARVTMPARWLLARRAEGGQLHALAVTHGPGRRRLHSLSQSHSLETSWLNASSSC